MNVVFAIAAFFIYGLLGRLKGTQNPFITTMEARIIYWGIPIALPIAFLTHNIWYTLAALILVVLGECLGYWGQFDIANPLNRNWLNYLRLTATALYRPLYLFLGSIIVGQEFHILPMLIISVVFVPCYYVTFWSQKLVTALRLWLPNLFDGYTALAEFLFRGCLGAAFIGGLYA